MIGKIQQVHVGLGYLYNRQFFKCINNEDFQLNSEKTEINLFLLDVDPVFFHRIECLYP